MPRIPRKLVIDPHEEGIYHCTNRCVRRAFLCGTDLESGRCFDHRKQWIQDRLEVLAGLFALDFLGFAVMSNHVHVIVRNRPDVAAAWSDEEVLRRWHALFHPDEHPAGEVAAEATRPAKAMPDPDRMAELRSRLSSISWFMGCLAGKIAIDANEEDKCSGRFWEGRFRCQPLVDEAALVACLAYIDLNPIRAGVAETPETSQFTSVFERIKALLNQPRDYCASHADECSAPQGVQCATEAPSAEHTGAVGAAVAPALAQRGTAGPDLRATAERSGCDWLSPFEVSEAGTSATVPAARASNTGCLPMRFVDYLMLLDWTGRELRAGKPGATPAELAPILELLQVTDEGWFRLVKDFSRLFRRAAGTPISLARHRKKWDRRRLVGISNSRAIFARPAA